MSIEVKLIAAAALVIALGAALFGYGRHEYNLGAAAVQARWDADKVLALEAAQKADMENRRIEQQRQTTINEVTQNAQTQIDQARTAAVAAAHAADGLRQQLAAFTARSRAAAGHSGTAGPGPGQQGADPLDLLAQLFTGADSAAGELAGYADRLRIAGAACEAAGDALR